MIKPTRLQPGDKVAIVSLSGGVLGEPFVAHEVKLLEQRLRELKLDFQYMPNSKKGIDFLREHPEARAADLKQAFADPEIKCIWCAIGGDDTFRTIPCILTDEFRALVQQNPKVFIGFSDTTTNHFTLNRLGLQTYYGPALLPDLAEFSPEMLPYTRDCIKNLFSLNRDKTVKISPVWYRSRDSFGPEQVGVSATELKETRGVIFLGPKKTVSGELLGGCLDILSEMLTHSRYPSEQKRIFGEYPVFPEREEWRGKILFIETSEEQPAPEKYQAMLAALENAGVFGEISGIIAGKPMDEKYLDEYLAILQKFAEKYQLPTAFNLNFGHAAPRMILPYGDPLEIDPAAKKISFKFPLVSATDEDIKQELKTRVSARRFEHSLLAADAARELAKSHGLNPARAYTAGLAHDFAKEFSPEENRRYVETYHLDPALLEDAAKNLVHAPVGAAAAQEIFGLDGEIAEVIARHTIPHVKMSDFAKVVFLADKIGRKGLPENLQPLPVLAKKDLNAAMKFFLNLQAEDLAARGIPQHLDTAAFLASLG